jgi:hypothetical protein
MPIPVDSSLLFRNNSRIEGLPPAVAPNQPLVYQQSLLFPGYRSGGKWHTFLDGAAAPTNAVVSSTLNQLKAFIIAVKSPVILTAKGVSVGTSAAGALMRSGIYNCGPGLYPTTLIEGSDPAQIDCSTTGLKDTAFSPVISLVPGYYAIAYQINVGATLAFKSPPVTALIANPETLHTTALSRTNHWLAPSATTFGALPTTYPTDHTPSPLVAPEFQFQIQ